MRIWGRFNKQGSFGERGAASGLSPRVTVALLAAALLVFALGGYASAKDSAATGPETPAIGFARDLTVIERIDISDNDGKTVIRAYADGPIRYFAIRQEQPPAVILNLTGTKIASPIPPFEVKNDLVDKVFVTQTASKSETSRILITLKNNAIYKINQTSDGLVVEVSQAAAEDVPAPAAASSAVIDKTAKAAITPASRILAVVADKSASGTLVAIKLDGHTTNYKSFIIPEPDPARLVIDVEGVTDESGERVISVESEEIARVRIGEHPGKVRVVLDLNKEDTAYAIESVENRILIALGDRSTNLRQTASASENTREIAAPRTAEAPKRAAPVTGTEARSASASTPRSSENPQPANKKVPRPIVPRATPVMAALDTPPETETDSGYLTEPSQVDFLAERPEISLGFRPGKIYHGNLISLDFKDAEIQNILRLIAEVSGLNVVAGEDVSGRVTVRLVNVPWDQALDVVLASHQLGYIRTGNIIRVAAADRLKAEEAQYLADRRSKEKLEDLVVKLQPLNYAKVTDAQEQVETLLSDRGTVNIDLRTNTLIIKDIPTVIEQAVKLVRRLDTRTPQVLIEAKIIEANLDFAKELGISYTADFLNSDIADGQNATQNGADFGNRVVNSGTSSTGSSFFSGALPITATPTGILAGSFTAIKDQLDLDVVISAMESSGHGRVISSPRIMTLDNKEAKIEQGLSIPFQTTEEGDTNLEFIDANLSLTVTPHVTNDDAIIMKIKVSRNAPDLSVPTATGDPAIAKNEATTEALVQDGETMVIGGIYVIDKSRNNQSIPYFNKIPFMQFLFRNYKVADSKNELIIFVTPRIVR